ncbi:LPS assembly protein LptD [Candidatus Berkiella cookevillensis]|uniref:LPS-assembly protein LptD n=1 Tax=Candidatus Berkiella cookevillensis TaxID=437022 RepID=A0AAE3HP12_9GAMM|nr:LPS assembly protein LptD [Candidatus Berkiella cookevillensis]MCS5707485.1 LPS assembly protein LptD [Candidatus Berkiella cookevillensis]
MQKKLIYLLAFLLQCWLHVVHGSSSCQFNLTPTDWEISTEPFNLCGGHYKPFYPPITNFSQPTNMPVNIEFDKGDILWEGQSYLHGVSLEQGQRWLHADKLTLKRSPTNWSVLADGHLSFHQPNMGIWADKAFYNNEDEYLQLSCGDFRWYPRHARAQAQSIEIFGQKKVVLHHSNFTTCPPTHQSWQLNAREIALYPRQGRAKAKHIYLKSKNVPIFYWPYLNYPIDNQRHSGFLFPSYSSSSQSGLSFTIPYYFNLAPNYDLTLGIQGFAKRGAGLQSHLRYLSKRTNGEFYLDYLPNDNAYRIFREETLQTIPSGYTTIDPRIKGIQDHNYRLGLGFNHHLQIGTSWSADINYHRVSDDNFFVDLGNDIHTTSTLHLPQRVQLLYEGQHWIHTFRTEEYQVLQAYKGGIVEEIYRRQPQWLFEALYPNIWKSLYFNLSGEAVQFIYPSAPASSQSKAEGKRYYLQPSLSYPIRRAWGELNPSVYLDLLSYDLKLPSETFENGNSFNHNPNRIAPIYTIDGKLYFERPLQLHHFDFIQTLTPRAFYVYIPYRNQNYFPNFDSGVIQFSYAQLFRYNRFSGKDRLNEANQLSLSVNSSILDKQNNFEWLRFGIGEIFYFKDEKVEICDGISPSQFCSQSDINRTSVRHSNLLSEIVFSSPQNWQSGAFIEWGMNAEFIQQASLFFQSKISDNALFNLNYYFTRKDNKNLDLRADTLGKLNQGDISLLIPLSYQFNLLTRFHYDFQFDQFVELLGGLEYNSCCFATQLVMSRYRQLGNALLGREYANQIMLQFVFKGLSSVGFNQPDRKLKQKIPGFVPLSERVSLPQVNQSKRKLGDSQQTDRPIDF